MAPHFMSAPLHGLLPCVEPEHDDESALQVAVYVGREISLELVQLWTPLQQGPQMSLAHRCACASTKSEGCGHSQNIPPVCWHSFC